VNIEKLGFLEEKKVAEEAHLEGVPHQFSSGHPMPAEKSG
jgi:hypothetical protein